jgi:tRNA modification GTPase
MISLDDTIAAISTPLGEGGIGIVRLSGPEAPAILRRIFLLPRGWRGGLAPRALHYGHVVDPVDGQVVDEVLAVHMPAPKTYTRQDLVEIQAHGGIVALRRILALCLRQGARMAEPGEYTARAFLHGRLDLAQAEAVLDIVRARTEVSLQAAMGQLAGRLSDKLRALRATLLEVLAYLEACLDFVEDEIPEREIGLDLAQVGKVLRSLLADADRGIVYRQGVRVAIVGRPNVGKSSLLNCLLRTNRAIVTEFPGTTRDTLEETLNLQGIPVLLVDTAGITARAQDPIEQMGVERSRTALGQADLALLVVDASQPPTGADRDIAALVDGKPAILVLNKIDLLADVHRGAAGELAAPLVLEAPSVRTSALTGQGLDSLEAAIVEAVFSGQVTASQAPLVTNQRHKEALCRALEHIEAACAANSNGQWPDLVAIDVAAAVHALGEITGQTASDELIETIFASFCIGK